MILLPLSVFSQSDREDVIYLKNGSIYRGTVIEQIPGVSYKIEIFGGSVVVILAADVDKVTKQEKMFVDRRSTPLFHYRDKGYFFRGEANFGMQLGFSLITGYKFGQYAMLGIGGGVYDIFPQRWTVSSTYTAGAYAPLYIYYGGDILKRRITPFYGIYAGYGFCFHTPDNSEGGVSGETTVTTKVQGGPMGGAELGVRFYTRHQVNLTLGVNLTIQHSIYWNNTYSSHIGYWTPTGYTTNTSQTYSSGAVMMYIPTFNFGIGF